ncbi:MAG: hypothetical protein ABIP21_09275 [Acidimicrobiia bacterium]
MRSFRRAAGVLVSVGVVAFALTGCGSDGSTAESGKAAPSVPSEKSRPEVVIETADFSFVAPAQIPAGYVDLTMKNTGKEGHHVQLIKLDGMTKEAFTTAVSNFDTAALKNSIFVGGPNGADPGASVTTTVKLEPGTYGIACLIPGADGQPHAAHGMTGTVEVARTANSVNTAPKSKGTVELGDFVFEPPTNFDGKGTFEIVNAGSQVHEAVIFGLNEGTTLEDAKKFLFAPPGTPPPAGPPPFSTVGGSTGLSNKERNWMTLDLKPGNYVFLCFFPDPTKDNMPHALEGMVKEFTVS